MKYSLNQASKAAGKSPSTIHNAIKKRRLSAVKGENGNWEIDAAELHRVYPMVSDEKAVEHPTSKESNSIERLLYIKELEIKLKATEERAATAEKDRDEWRKQAQTLLLAPPKAKKKSGLWQWLGRNDNEGAAA